MGNSKDIGRRASAIGRWTFIDPESGISRALARERARLYRDVRYNLSFDIAASADRLRGREQITFTLTAPTASLIIDFRDVDAKGAPIEGTVHDIKVNGAAVRDARQARGHLIIPGHYLSVGSNRVELSFESSIRAAGTAVTRYIDKNDGAEYIYTLFVPSDANLAFPCFDQPDIKARFLLDITAPDGWTVVSNGAIEDAQAARAGYRRVRFKETLPISTYLVCFRGGALR